ncbi:hypothetical protein JCM18750_33470 [Halostagnicola bangensis]
MVRENLQDVDKEITELGDGTVILCTDEHTTYDDDTYVIGDIHVNSCEKRHSFLRQ